MDDITENIIRVATSAIRFNNRLALSYNQHLTNKKSIQPIMISKQSMTKSHSGLPFGTAPTDAAHSRIIFIACMRYRRGRPAKASRRESYVRTEFMTNGIRS